jgi:hypothetical protein
MVPVNVYAYAVLSTPQILGFTSGYILIFLRGTPQNLTRLHAYASGSPDDPCKLTRYFIGFRDPATPELLHKSKLESLVDMDFPKLINIGDV